MHRFKHNVVVRREMIAIYDHLHISLCVGTGFYVLLQQMNVADNSFVFLIYIYVPFSHQVFYELNI